MQPVYGFISGRYARRFFAVFGPAITGLFISSIGLSSSYGVLVLLLMAGGIGIGSFHPQAAAMASVAAGQRRRVGLSLFSAMGTIGYSFGPLAIPIVINAFGLVKTYYVVGVGLLMTAVLYRICPPLPGPVNRESASVEVASHHTGHRSELVRALRAVWKPLLLLYLITVLRSGLQFTTNNYLPFLLRERGYVVTGTGAVMTVFLLMGGLGGLAGGFIAERFSGRAVTLYSGLLAGPIMVAAIATQGPLGIVLLGIGGFVLLSTIPVNVAMAQELVPGQTSTVSALMMGAAWGVGALAPPVLDNLVPAFGFRRVLIFASAFSLVSALLAYLLPREEHARHQLLESDLATATSAGD